MAGRPLSPGDVSAGNPGGRHPVARSLKRRIGLTPGEIRRGERQLSFLYKIDPA
jgi:hypothetical protein